MQNNNIYNQQLSIANKLCKIDEQIDEQEVISDASLQVDYVYLDEEERRRFSQVGHEYLIENTTGGMCGQNKMKLSFSHPIKELLWAIKRTNNK